MAGHRGLFKPINPLKYKGNVNNIVYRSSWELAVMRRFDIDPNVVSWASEELCVPYADRVTGRNRRYFPDFLIKKKDRAGNFKIYMIEIKPYSQSVPPTKGKKTEKRFLTEVKTYANNFSKWEYAREYCRRRGWEFVVLTERELGIK